jgi:hypothetical protein
MHMVGKDTKNNTAKRSAESSEGGIGRKLLDQLIKDMADSASKGSADAGNRLEELGKEAQKLKSDWFGHTSYVVGV